MHRKFRFVALILLPFVITPVFAGDGKGLTGCQSNKDWVGTYTVTNVSQITGSTYVTNYMFFANGTVTGFFTGAPDLALSTGSITDFAGSWKCRRDGNIVFSMIYASYNGGGTDLFLNQHVKSTSEISIVDGNTLERIDLALRVYSPNEDPSDPAAGFVFAPEFFARTYSRLQVAEGDLEL